MRFRFGRGESAARNRTCPSRARPSAAFAAACRAHGVTRFVRWQKRFRRFNRTHHFLFWLAHAHPADRVAVEIKLYHGLRRCAPKVIEGSALDDAEDELTSCRVRC